MACYCECENKNKKSKIAQKLNFEVKFDQKTKITELTIKSFYLEYLCFVENSGLFLWIEWNFDSLEFSLTVLSEKSVWQFQLEKMELSEEIKFSSLMPDKLDITTAKADTFRHWLQQWKDYCQMASLDDQVRTAPRGSSRA